MSENRMPAQVSDRVVELGWANHEGSDSGALLNPSSSQYSSVLSILLSSFLVSPAFAGQKSLGDLTGPWQLFVDDHLIAEKQNVRRSYHVFQKHPANPVLVADKPWEGKTAYVYGTVLPTEDRKGYRMWYHAWSERSYRNLYATSKDGLRWDKPSLGLVDYKGSKQNNILFRRTHEDHNPQVIHTPWEHNRSRRYKLINYDYGRTPPKHTVSGYWGATSPDGIHWTDVSKNPILRDPGDVGNFVWDPHAKRYVGWPKKFTTVRGFRRRCVGFTETRDFEHWPETRMALVPDEFDDRWVEGGDAHTDFYGLCGFAYESMYIGLLWVFRITDGKNDGPIFVELVSSRDGVHWIRQEKPRTPILPTGPKGAWDSGMVFTTSHPLVEGEAIKLWYGGFDVTHGSGSGRASVGFATLRKDGFASLDAGEEVGVITTKPLRGAHGSLRINYHARDGWVKVEVLSADGTVLPGYGGDQCDVLKGDRVDQTVTWASKRQLPEGSDAIRVRLLLKNASVYSFDAGDRLKME